MIMTKQHRATDSEIKDVLREAKGMEENYFSSLYDVTRWFDTFKFAGDHANRLTVVLAYLIGRKCVGIESLSGSGKTHMADTVMMLIPHESWIHEIGLTSRTAPFYEMEKINECRYIYLPELQKAIGSQSGDLVIEILKNFGEGKPIDRPVTDVHRGGVKRFKLAWKPYLYTLATENLTKPDTELSRRVLKVYTDISREQTEEVLKIKALSRFAPQKIARLPPALRIVLIDQIRQTITLPVKTHRNPFALYVSQKIPPMFVQSRTCIDHFFDLTDAITKFHHMRHERLSSDNTLFTTLSDMYMINVIYAEPFLLDVIQVPPLGRFIIRLLIGENQPCHLNDMQLRLSESGITLKVDTLKKILEGLLAAGYVTMDEETRRAYQITPFFKNFDALFNWCDMYKSGCEQMKEMYPDLFSLWDKTNRTPFAHPVTGKQMGFDDIISDVQQLSKEVQSPSFRDGKLG